MHFLRNVSNYLYDKVGKQQHLIYRLSASSFPVIGENMIFAILKES